MDEQVLDRKNLAEIQRKTEARAKILSQELYDFPTGTTLPWLSPQSRIEMVV
jgi:hypothetical protein